MPPTVSPAIDTERLTLRVPRREDFEEALAMWGDPKVTRYIGGKPSTREEMWARLLRYVGHWELMGFGFWVVREKSTGRFVGEVGLADFRRDIEPSLGGSKEAGWVLSPWAHGKGFATEALRAALRWVEGRFGPERVVCIIDPENEASLKVAHKCGFREFARGTYKGDPTSMLERLPEAGQALVQGAVSNPGAFNLDETRQLLERMSRFVNEALGIEFGSEA